MAANSMTLTRMFELRGGTYGILNYGDSVCWVMEAGWQGNLPYVSCVPTGFYQLRPHNGERYQDTFAILGQTVGHTADDGGTRFACVFHAAAFPSQLQGCFAPAMSIGPAGMAIGSREALDGVLAYIRDADRPSLLIERGF